MTLPRMTLKLAPSRVPVRDRVKIARSLDAEKVFRKLYDPEKIELREEFYLLCLNRAGHVIGWEQISIGGVNGTVADIRLIMDHTILANASSIIVCHNHPSGNLEPSHADILLTKKLNEACKLFDVVLSDHLILTSESYYSFADEGKL